MSVLSPFLEPVRRYFKTIKRKRKARARQAAFASDLWRREGGTVLRRYASYEDYVSHQAAKLDNIADRLRRYESEDLAIFTERFRSCSALAVARSVLCLGARLGTEVKALHALGHFAVGIDLNPGSDNPYVLPGDFHAIVFPEESVDAVYTNALDHAFDLDRVIGEARRVLRPEGIFIIDVIAGYDEGFVPGAYEAMHWRSAGDLVDKVRRIGGFTLEEWRDLGRIRRDCWKQAVLRKATASSVGDAGQR